QADAVRPRILRSRWSSDDGIEPAICGAKELRMFDSSAQVERPHGPQSQLGQVSYRSEKFYLSSEKTSGPNLCPFRSPSSTSAILSDRNEVAASSSTWSRVTLSISAASSSSGISRPK